MEHVLNRTHPRRSSRSSLMLQQKFTSCRTTTTATDPLHDDSINKLMQNNNKQWRLDQSVHNVQALRSSSKQEPSVKDEVDPQSAATVSEELEEETMHEDLDRLKACWERLGHLFPHDSYQLPVDFPKFAATEIEVGELLGQGSFCTVFNVESLKATATVNTTIPSKQSSAREFVSERCLDAESKARYAVKRLQERYDHELGTRDDGIEEDLYWQSKVDLVVETRILSQVTHPHIVKCRAIARGSPLGDGYFILLDRLYGGMLHERLEWASQERAYETSRRNNCFKSIFLPFDMTSRTQRKRQFQERLRHAYDLATALDYLHQLRIVHRDVKPANVGFDGVRVMEMFIS